MPEWQIVRGIKSNGEACWCNVMDNDSRLCWNNGTGSDRQKKQLTNFEEFTIHTRGFPLRLDICGMKPVINYMKKKIYGRMVVYSGVSELKEWPSKLHHCHVFILPVMGIWEQLCGFTPPISVLFLQEGLLRKVKSRIRPSVHRHSSTDLS